MRVSKKEVERARGGEEVNSCRLVCRRDWMKGGLEESVRMWGR